MKSSKCGIHMDLLLNLKQDGAIQPEMEGALWSVQQFPIPWATYPSNVLMRGSSDFHYPDPDLYSDSSRASYENHKAHEDNPGRRSCPHFALTGIEQFSGALHLNSPNNGGVTSSWHDED